MKIKEIIFWILVLISIVVLLLYLFGNSLTFEQTILILMLTIIFGIGTKIAVVGERINHLGKRFGKLENSFFKLSEDFKEHLNKKNVTKKLILFFIFGIFLIGIISSAVLPTGGVSYCCEKTTTGAWCQNAPAEKCDADFRKVPTSCEATSYCKLGCCYDSQEGTCMENTPQKVCEDNNGIWGDNAKCEIPQCDLGCCLIGDQAAFVTQTRCKRLSSLYGLEIDFRTSIQNEVQCIASATSDVKGACVFEKEFEKTCLFTTKRDCLDMKAKNSTNAEFHEGFLCSAEELGTICGPSEKTKCVEGKDEVYFVDTCGNPANIYDSSKIKSKEYWSKIYGKEESCNPSSSNANSKNCGNCDYFLGSTCKDYKQTGDKIKPNKGNYIWCDLGCEFDGKTYQHG